MSTHDAERPGLPLLSDIEERQVRDKVGDAVLSPDGLREELERDPQAYLRLVHAGRVAADESNLLLRESVAGARAAGHSWDALGGVLGVSRQAAHQRFGFPSPPGSSSSDGQPARRVLTPLTAFDEMSVLETEGAKGWHVVSYGPLYHVVEASSVQWKHRRLAWGVRGRRERMESEGWTAVPGSTFPWSYWKRPTGRPAADC